MVLNRFPSPVEGVANCEKIIYKSRGQKAFSVNSCNQQAEQLAVFRFNLR